MKDVNQGSLSVATEKSFGLHSFILRVGTKEACNCRLGSATITSPPGEETISVWPGETNRQLAIPPQGFGCSLSSPWHFF